MKAWIWPATPGRQCISLLLCLVSHNVCLPRTACSFLWLVVFGGAGLQMERNAARHGVVCSYSADIPPDAPIGFVCLDSNGMADPSAKVTDVSTGVTDTCADGYTKISRLSCYSAERQYFLLWEQFAGYR